MYTIHYIRGAILDKYTIQNIIALTLHLRVVHFIGRIVMSRQNFLFWLERIGLSLAFGTTLVATRLFVLRSGFYDMSRTHQNVGSDWLLDFVVFAACCLALLMTYTDLARKRQTDMALIEYIGIPFLGIGGLLGIMSTCFDGWRSGLDSFLLGGITGVTIAICCTAFAYTVVYLGKRLDHLILNLKTKGV